MDSQPLSRPTHHHITPITHHSHTQSPHHSHHTSLTHHITPPPQVYCSLPAGAEEVEGEMIKETVKRECCQQTYWRITSNSLKVVSWGQRGWGGCAGDVPPSLQGALWHIYAASDTDRIRSFLRKVDFHSLCSVPQSPFF